MFTIEMLRERSVAVIEHDDNEDTIVDVRRPLYQHMIMEELVGGPSILRFRSDGKIDILVGTHLHFEGDHVATVDILPAGTYAVEQYEGTEDGLPAARQHFLAAVAKKCKISGDLLQVHLMDPIDGDIEQEFQILVTDPPA